MSSTRFYIKIKQFYAGLIPIYPLGYIIVHGFRGDQFWTKLYVDRSALEPSEHLKELAENEVVKIDGLKKAKFRVTLTDEMEPKTFGALFLTNGAEIQLPLRLTLDDVETTRRIGANLEIDLGLSKNRRKVEVNSDTGDELISRLMLSESAKKFIIQRQFQIANSGEFFVAPVFAWFGISTISYLTLNGFSMIVGPIGAAIGASTLAIGGFWQFRKIFEEYKTKKADEIVIRRGEDYARGALDYFQSTMKLNRLYRKILGEEGDRQILRNGDSAVDSVLLSTRIKEVKRIQKEIQKSQRANEKDDEMD